MPRGHVVYIDLYRENLKAIVLSESSRPWYVTLSSGLPPSVFFFNFTLGPKQFEQIPLNSGERSKNILFSNY